MNASLHEAEEKIVISREDDGLVVRNHGPLKPNTNAMFRNTRQCDEARHLDERGTHLRSHSLQFPPILSKPFIPILVPLNFYALNNQLVGLLVFTRLSERLFGVVN